MIGSAIPNWNPRDGVRTFAAWHEAVKDAALMGGFYLFINGDKAPTVEEVVARFAGSDMSVEELAQMFVNCEHDYNELNKAFYFIVRHVPLSSSQVRTRKTTLNTFRHTFSQMAVCVMAWVYTNGH